MSGVVYGELTVIAARTSMGKTAGAQHRRARGIACEPAGRVFSMEMTAVSLVNRMPSAAGSIDGTKLRTGKFDDPDWERLTKSVGKLHSAPLHIDETPALSTSELRPRARRLHREYHKLGLVVVDYLQLLQAKAENRTQEVSAISRAMKALAKELDCPVIALSQLNRELAHRTDKRPQLSDLRESGDLEA